MTLSNAVSLKQILRLHMAQTYKPFLILTWPGDLTFGGLSLKISHKVSYSITSRYWKTELLCVTFFAICEKNILASPHILGHILPPHPVRVLTKSYWSVPESLRPTELLLCSLCYHLPQATKQVCFVAYRRGPRYFIFYVHPPCTEPDFARVQRHYKGTAPSTFSEQWAL